jgi:DNA uptake protein ComE-like DNA-binding protein
MVRKVAATMVLAITLMVGGALTQAQVAKGLLDPNIATEQELGTVPHLTPAIAKAVVGKRPFLSATDFAAFLTTQGLTAEQRTEVYRKAFVHINLNTATASEIMLIPGAGKRMAHEFDEYRPWKSFAQFDKEIGKYVNAAEVERLKSYTFIPLNPNSASDADFMTIPGVGARMVHEFKEYRPWKSQQQFEKEIGKYVNEREVARLWRYMALQ